MGNKNINTLLFILLIWLINFQHTFANDIQIESFIKRLYLNIYDREADKEGLNFWKEELKRGKSATEIAKFFYKSPEMRKMNLSDEEFLKRTYKTFFDREPDKEGYNYWLKQLKNEGAKKDQVFYGFALSFEFENICNSYGIEAFTLEDKRRAYIERFYNLIIQREADEEGVKYWLKELESKNKTPSDIAKSFFFSQEFLNKHTNNKDFITIAYKTLLNREPDSQGFSYWLGELNKGVSKEKIVDMFLISKEFKNITNKFLEISPSKIDPYSTPRAPSGFKVKKVGVDSVILVWNDNSNNEKGFKLYKEEGKDRELKLIATLPPNTTSYKDTDLKSNFPYRYQIRSFNDMGTSPLISLSTVTLAKAPYDVYVEQTKDYEITIKWKAHTIFDEFNIYRNGKLIAKEARGSIYHFYKDTLYDKDYLDKTVIYTIKAVNRAGIENTVLVSEDEKDGGTISAKTVITPSPSKPIPSPHIGGGHIHINKLPIVNAGVDIIITEGENVTLIATASDPDGKIVNYEWREGNTLLSKKATFSKNDFSVGEHILTLTVKDDKGAVSKDEIKITVISLNDRFYAAYLSSKDHKELSKKIVKMQKPDEINIFALTPNIIEIDFVAQYKNGAFVRTPIDSNKTEDVNNFSIFSPDDPNYSSFIHPLKSGLRRRVMYAPLAKDDLRILERIYLKLPFDMQEYKNYLININSSLTGKTHSLNLEYKKERISTIIHIDPEGYLPNDKKKAYMGMQLGSMGEIIPLDLSFEVKRVDTNESVYRGIGTIENSEGWRDNFTNLDTLYKHVVKFDFSALTKEGEYFIQSPIGGRSQPFEIRKDVYRKTLNTIALGIYNQRRGEDIVMPYSRHERLATIENNTYIYDSNDLDPFITNDPDFNGIKYPTDNEGKKVDFLAAGHMDAGDYSIYTYNSSMFVWNLLAALDLFGEKIYHDNLGIPESGDGIPDIYQEMMLDLKWLMGMQDSDGGVFGMSKPKGMNYQNTMTGVDPNLHRYLSPKDTPHTASFAAVMARAARSKIIKKYNPELIDTFKQKALKAWEWLEKNSGYDGWHHYGMKNGDMDDRVWAAIELYALTGERKYHDFFVQNHKPELRDNGVEWFNGGYGYANRVVAMWDKEGIPYPIDSNIKTQSIDRYKNMLEHYIELSNKTPYDVIMEDARKRWNQLGWFFPISAYGYDLCVGHFLYGDERYLDLAKDQIHFTLGANPNNQSYITGIGNKRLHSLVDQKSLYDTIEEPVNGLPVSPIVTGSSWLSQYGNNLTNYTYPKTTYDFSEGPSYGLLDESYDGWNTNAEFTIEKLGAMLIVLAYITDVENSSYDYPHFNLSIEQIANGKFKPKINFEDKIPKGKVIWFENGKPISVDPYFILEQNFTDPTYKLAAQFITDKGRRWFSEIMVNTRDYTNTDIPLEPFSDQNYSRLWHFDNSLTDTKGDISLHFKGNAKFDQNNLFWMKEQNGSAIRVNGYGDGVEGEMYMTDLLEGKNYEDVNTVIVEALIYPELIPPKKGITYEYIKFAQSWTAQLQLLRFNWDDDIKVRLSKEILGDDGKITQALTEHRWHYVKMKIDRARLYLYIDGKEIYNKARDEAANAKLFDQRVISIYLGDFVGWIDEFRVSIKTD